MSQGALQVASIATLHATEAPFKGLVESPMLHVGNGFQYPRRDHGRQREGHKTRYDHRAAERNGKFNEEPSRDGCLERQREKHRRQGHGGGDDGKGDLFHPLLGGLHRRHTILDVPIDVFEHHDRVIDHHADRQHQGEHGQRVNCIAHCRQDHERGHNRDRNG